MMMTYFKSYTKFFVFLVGFCFGALVAFILVCNEGNTRIDSVALQEKFNIQPFDYRNAYDHWFMKHNLKMYKHSHQCTVDGHLSKNITRESQYLFSKVKIACIILYLNDSQFYQILNTWVKTCNSYYFVGSVNEISDYVNLVVETHDGSNWRQFYNFVKKHFSKLTKYEWFFFAVDSNLLVMVENLRHLLVSLRHNENHYLGRSIVRNGITFNEAEAGFVLSRGALRKLSNIFRRDDVIYASKNVDFNLGTIFMDHHVVLQSTLDSNGCTRFHSENLEELFEKVRNKQVPCVSDSAVTFSVSDNLDSVYTYFYLLQTARVVDRNDLKCDILPPASLTKDDYSKWLFENQDFLGVDPRNITKEQFYDMWLNQVDRKELIF